MARFNTRLAWILLVIILISTKSLSEKPPSQPTGYDNGSENQSQQNFLASWSESKGVRAKRFTTDWGQRIDPDKDCTFDRVKGELIISIPGKDHDLAIERSIMNAPRLVREVEGDFTIQVRVQCAFRLSSDNTEAFQEAGLLLWADEKNYIRLGHRSQPQLIGSDLRFLERESEKTVSFAHLTLRENGKRRYGGDLTVLPLTEGKSNTLRLVRRENVVQGFVSQDGKKWQHMEEMKICFPKKLKVGIVAISICSDRFKTKFDNLFISNAKAKK